MLECLLIIITPGLNNLSDDMSTFRHCVIDVVIGYGGGTGVGGLASQSFSLQLPMILNTPQFKIDNTNVAHWTIRN